MKIYDIYLLSIIYTNAPCSWGRIPLRTFLLSMNKRPSISVSCLISNLALDFLIGIGCSLFIFGFNSQSMLRSPSTTNCAPISTFAPACFFFCSFALALFRYLLLAFFTPFFPIKSETTTSMVPMTTNHQIVSNTKKKKTN